MDNNGYFVITSVHRDDLEAAGFDSSKVTDEQMELLAKYMANDYLKHLFWASLKYIAEERLEIPLKRNIKYGEDNSICLELSNGSEVEVKNAWIIEDNDSYNAVEIWDTNTNEVIGMYKGSLPDIDDEDFDIDSFIEKIEEAIDNYKTTCLF